MMSVQITSINLQYEGNIIHNVKVYFSGYDDDREINVNGCISLSAEEYAGNEAIETLTELVQTKTIERLSPAV